MKLAILTLYLCVSAVLAHPHFRASPAERCTGVNCVASDGCFCSKTISPLPTEDTPQFVTLTFDDAVTDAIYTNYYEPILFDRTNPDGNPISGTFYAPHEYSDYERVNDLYNRGFQIAVNSISKNPMSDYWQTASVDTLVDEFGGDKQIISEFANIPIDDIIGARIPNLALGGNTSFKAYVQSGIQYDNSWTSGSSRHLFPYTLDYLSTQDCTIGACPNEPFPGTWVVPIINFKRLDGYDCNALFSCQVDGTADEIKDWLSEQFNNIHLNNRAPITLMVNSAWFTIYKNSLEAFVSFLDDLQSNQNVFLVSHSEVINWMKNPVPLAEYTSPIKNRDQPCDPRICKLAYEDDFRFMKSCVACPSVYPWVGNPLGEF